MGKFDPREIPNFDQLNNQAREILCTIPEYIRQLAQSQQRKWNFENLPVAIAGEELLNTWIRVNIIRLVWIVLLDYPLQPMVHPAIQLVRDQNVVGSVRDVIIDEDLSSWLPEVQGYAIDLSRGGDALEQGIPVGAG